MNVEQIKPDSLIKLEFSTHFCARMYNLILHYTETRPTDELTAAYRKIGTDAELDQWEEDLETLLVLVQSIETGAKEQNLTEVVQVPDNLS